MRADPAATVDSFATSVLQEYLLKPRADGIFRGTFTLARLPGDGSDGPVPMATYPAYGRTQSFDEGWAIGLGSRKLQGATMHLLGFPGDPIALTAAVDTTESLVPSVALPQLWLSMYGATIAIPLSDSAVTNSALGTPNADGTVSLQSLAFNQITLAQPEGSLGPDSNGGLDRYLAAGSLNWFAPASVTFEDLLFSDYATVEGQVTLLADENARNKIVKSGSDYLYTLAADVLYARGTPVADAGCGKDRHGHAIDRFPFSTLSFTVRYTIPNDAPAAATYAVVTVGAPVSTSACGAFAESDYPKVSGVGMPNLF